MLTQAFCINSTSLLTGRLSVFLSLLANVQMLLNTECTLLRQKRSTLQKQIALKKEEEVQVKSDKETYL